MGRVCCHRFAKLLSCQQCPKEGGSQGEGGKGRKEKGKRKKAGGKVESSGPVLRVIAPPGLITVGYCLPEAVMGVGEAGDREAGVGMRRRTHDVMDKEIGVSTGGPWRKRRGMNGKGGYSKEKERGTKELEKALDGCVSPWASE